MKTKGGLITYLTIALLGLSSMGVHATPIMVGEAQPITADGQNFVFNYSGLPASDGTGGTFLFRARGDYTIPDETATISLEDFGSLVLGVEGVASNTITGLTLIENNSEPIFIEINSEPILSPHEVFLEYVFDVSTLLLHSLLADGNIVVEVDNSDSVNVNDPPPSGLFNFVRANFNYESSTEVSPPSEVPVPAAIWLFGTALIVFIRFGSRRKIV